MEIIIGLSGLLVISCSVIAVLTVKINKIKVAGIKADTIVKQANRQADKTIKDAKSQADKESKSITRRAEEDIAFKRRQLKETEQDIHHKKQQVQKLKNENEKLQEQLEQKIDGIKELTKKTGRAYCSIV